MKYLSKSAIIVYDVCPQKYKIQFIDKIKLPKLPEALIQGINAHKNLEHYIKNLNLEEVMKSPRKEIERAMYDKLSNDQINKLKGFCEYDITRAANCIKYGKSLEEYFMPKHIELYMRSNKYGLSGRLDRIDKLFTDKLAIFDYKTGPKKPISLWNELELCIYYLLYKDNYPSDNISIAGILYTEHPSPLQKLQITDQLLSAALEKVETTRDCINMGLFAPSEKPLFGCPCEYSKYCIKFNKEVDM